jgi:Lactoylglutathione lyase and related lyases
MDNRISVITLGVFDLEKSVAFYRDGLKLKTDGIIGTEYENGAVAFFELQSGLKLALWPFTSIAHDTNLPTATNNPATVTIGHNVNSKAEVVSVMHTAQQAGATIIRPAHDTFWGGYSGYFTDPNGHIWEVVWNPAISV